MITSDTCFSLSNVNSISQIAPMYHNVPAQTSQINFLQQQQQQQQQQQSNNQQQPMQCQQYYCYPTNQQGTFPQNQYVQSYQQDPYGVNPQQQSIPRTGLGNLGQPLAQTSYNVPSIMQPQALGYGSLPPSILDQIRSYIGTPAPIFILPSNCPNPPNQPQPVLTNPSVTQGCPGIGINCPSSAIHGCPAGLCYPHPVGMQSFNQRSNSPQNAVRESKNCGCCHRKNLSQDGHRTASDPSAYEYPNDVEQHRCRGASDDTICSQKNCPSAINLQALASQLLAIPGIISCTATRLILRKVPGSNITNTMEETMERAKKSLTSLNKEQLLAETRGAQQVNALINLHMTANPPANVIPILTTLQLKVNLLKSQVDSSLNRRLSENQGYGSAEGAGNLDSVMLATKSDQELRDLLGTLRQKECDERVNLNFAPYQSQRVIAESRLTNVQNKIAQIEEEMDRRRAAVLPRSSMAHRVSHQSSDPGCAAWYGYTGDINNTSWMTSTSSQSYESPDPFRGIQVRNPKRLNLKPHVGSPETTYGRPGKTSTLRSSRSKKDSDDEDWDEDERRAVRSTSVETRCCNCDKSSDEDSADEGKKKLGGKIHVPREIVSERAGRKSRRENGAVSVVKLSPNVTIVIDNTGNPKTVKCRRYGNNRKQTTADRIGDDAEKESSIASELMTSTVAERKNDEKSTLDETKRFERTNNQVRDHAGTQYQATTHPTKEVHATSRIERNANKIEDNVVKIEETKYKSAAGTANKDNIDLNRNDSEPESLREETVRMITNIRYEPTAFRGYHDSDALEKEKIVEERYKGNPFTEDSSSNSTSTDSTIGGNFINETVAARVENYEECFVNAVRKNSEKNLERPDVIEKIDKIVDISGNTKNDTNKEEEERTNDETRRETLTGSEENESKNDLISGALSTIGNHVASFGSLIGKIATLKLHRTEEESSNEIFPESISKNRQPEIDDNVATGSQGNSRVNDESKRDIGRWRYIRFSDVQDSTCTSIEDVDSNRKSSTYTLPKIKHSVLEDKENGEKYVVMERPSKSTNRQLGEPYKTGRSLVIRSRLKSPPVADQSGPFTVVRGPRKRDKNCIALSLADVRSLGKNRSKNNNELKMSEKFWLKSETREITSEKVESRGISKSLMKKDERRDDKSLDPHCSHDDNSNFDSMVTATDENIVQIHDYSKSRINPRIRFDPAS